MTGFEEGVRHQPDPTNWHEFAAAQADLGLSDKQAAHILNVAERTLRRWKANPERSTTREPSPTACRIMGWMLNGFRPPQWPD